jgi:hypothetical protein
MKTNTNRWIALPIFIIFAAARVGAETDESVALDSGLVAIAHKDSFSQGKDTGVLEYRTRSDRPVVGLLQVAENGVPKVFPAERSQVSLSFRPVGAGAVTFGVALGESDPKLSESYLLLVQFSPNAGPHLSLLRATGLQTGDNNWPEIQRVRLPRNTVLGDSATLSLQVEKQSDQAVQLTGQLLDESGEVLAKVEGREESPIADYSIATLRCFAIAQGEGVDILKVEVTEE